MGQSSAIPSTVRTLKSCGRIRTHWAQKCTVEPPTALYITGRDRRVGDLERVVGGLAPDVRVRAPLGVRDELPLELVARELGDVRPAALLEADDAEAGFGQVARGDRAAGAGADDEHVGPVGATRERLNESGSTFPFGFGAGGACLWIGPRSMTASRMPSRRSYSASSANGGRLPWPGNLIRLRTFRFM